MKPLSIRWKIGLFSALLTGVALLVFAGGTLINLYQEQIEAVDLEITEEAREMVGLYERGAKIDSADVFAEHDYDPWIAAAIFDARGHLRVFTETMPEAVARAAVTDHAVRTVGDGPGSWRVGAFPLGKELLVVGYNLEEVHNISVDLLTAYTLSLPLVAGVAALGGWILGGRILRPVRALTTTAEAITSRHLDRRVPSSGINDEIGRLAGVFNAMLARLEASFRQAERFAADASHDLRTPLTIMRGEVDRLLREPGMTSAAEERLVSLQQEISRLDRICGNLLLLARLDAGQSQVGADVVDLSALVQEACGDAEMLGAAQQVRIETEVAAGLSIRGDGDLLYRALLHLVENGIKFNQADGCLRVRLRGDGPTAVLSVENTGPSIPVEQRARIFERFYRGDTARPGGSHGLGLSLAWEIAAAHHGSLELLEPAAPGWTGFVLKLPRIS